MFFRKSSPNITSFMKENNISTYVQLMELYVTKVLDIVERTNKSYVIWQDPIEDGTKVSWLCVTSCFRRRLFQINSVAKLIVAYSELYSSQILNCFIYVWRIDALIDYLDYPAYLTIYSIELSIFLVTKTKGCKYIYTWVT